MNNSDSILKTIGYITIGLGGITAFIVGAILNDSYVLDDMAIPIALIIFFVSFIFGMIFVGFGTIITLLQDILIATRDNNSNNISNLVYNSSSSSSPSEKEFVLDYTFGTLNGKKLHWSVLKSNSASISLICNNVVGYANFSNNNEEWTNSKIRSFLNEEFYNHVFSDTEKEQIIATKTHQNTVNGQSNNDLNTYDKIFLIQTSAIEKYLPNEANRKCNDLNGNEANWWTRTSGYSSDSVCYVDKNGMINKAGQNKTISCGIRPIIVIKA